MHKKDYFPPVAEVVPLRMETAILTGSDEIINPVVFDPGATIEPLIEDDVFIF